MLGCANMTEREKQTAWIVGGVVVAAVIISSSKGSSTVINDCKHSIVIHPDGSSDQICR